MGEIFPSERFIGLDVISPDRCGTSHQLLNVLLIAKRPRQPSAQHTHGQSESKASLLKIVTFVAVHRTGACTLASGASLVLRVWFLARSHRTSRSISFAQPLILSPHGFPRSILQRDTDLLQAV